jgi:hypothetical protein
MREIHASRYPSYMSYQYQNIFDYLSIYKKTNARMRPEMERVQLIDAILDAI